MEDKMMATFIEDYLWRTIYRGQFIEDKMMAKYGR